MGTRSMRVQKLIDDGSARDIGVNMYHLSGCCLEVSTCYLLISFMSRKCEYIKCGTRK